MPSSFGTNFTVHWRYTEALWTASPVMRKFPEWQFPLGFGRKQSPLEMVAFYAVWNYSVAQRLRRRGHHVTPLRALCLCVRFSAWTYQDMPAGANFSLLVVSDTCRSCVSFWFWIVQGWRWLFLFIKSVLLSLGMHFFSSFSKGTELLFLEHRSQSLLHFSLHVCYCHRGYRAQEKRFQ